MINVFNYAYLDLMLMLLLSNNLLVSFQLIPILSELIERTTVLLPSLLHLLTSERMVSIDVLNALGDVQRLYGYKVSLG